MFAHWQWLAAMQRIEQRECKPVFEFCKIAGSKNETSYLDCKALPGQPA